MKMLIDTALLKFRIFIHQNRIVKKKKKEGLPRWLSLCSLNAGALGSIPGEGTRSHMLQLRPSAVK